MVELLDEDGVLVATTTTTDGSYLFEGLLEGTYQVQLPSTNVTGDGVLLGHVPSTGAASSVNPDDDIDGNNDGFGQPGEAIKSGLVTLALTTEPSNGDGSANYTVDFGVLPRLAIASTIWMDVDNDGVLDTDEPPLPGVIVQLLDESGLVLAEAITDENGDYFFADLDPGSYQIQIPAENFAPGGALEGFAPSTGAATGQGENIDGNNDGVLVGEDLRSGLIVLAYGEEVAGNGLVNTTADFGLVQLGELAEFGGIGGIVWDDVNSDGIQDPDEPGVPGVEVALIDAEVALATTGDDGRFLFDSLTPGTYSVEVDLSTAPDNTVVTVANAGDEDSVDSDFDSSGTIQDIVLEPGDQIAVDLGLATPDFGTPPDILAFTGLNSAILVTVGPMLALAGIALVALSRRRRWRPLA